MGRPLDEDELVALAKRGDAAAFEELVARYQMLAFRTAYVITGSAEEAEEAATDGFLKAHGALGRFKRGRPFRPWLLSIVGNEARNRRRAAGRRHGLVLRVAEQGRPGDAAPSPEAAVLEAERRRLLVSALERLPEEQRLVVACRYLLDLNESETAAALGLRPGTAKSRLSRALERLREEVGDDA